MFPFIYNIYIRIYIYIYCIIVSIFYIYIILYTHYTCIHTIRQANLMVSLCFFIFFPAVVFLQIAIVWWMFGCCFFVAPLNWWGKKYRTELKKRERGDLKKWPTVVSELRGPICFMDFIMGVNPKLGGKPPKWMV